MKNVKRIRRADRRKYHYIYETICLISHKFYIGMHSTDNLQDGYCGSGKYLWNSINKHGKDKHVTKILEFLPDRKSLKNREKELINEELLNNQYCMNLASGGEGGVGCFTKEQLRKGAEKANERMDWLRKNNPEWVKKRSEKHSKTVKEKYKTGELTASYFYDWNGKKLKQSHKDKIGKANSVQQKGKRNSQYGTCWICNLKLGKVKKIKKEELHIYLNQGWVRGKKVK